MDSLRPVIGRLVAALMGALFGWLAHRFELTVDPQTQEATSLAVQGFVMLAVYGIVHKTLNQKLNPMDTASVTLSRPESAQVVKDAVKAELPPPSGI